MKIKFGSIVTDGSGKIGGHVVAKNRSGHYLRTKVTPSNPRTSAQSETRAILGTLSSAWSALTPEERATWNGAVNNWSSTNIFGDIKNPTGKNLFVGLNKNLLESGQTAINTAPDKQEIPYLGVSVVEGDASSNQMTAVASNTATGFFINVYATAPQTQGTGFFKGKYRKIATISGADINTADFGGDYVTKFGDFLEGANIAFEFKVVGTNGQVGTPENAKANIVA